MDNVSTKERKKLKESVKENLQNCVVKDMWLIKNVAEKLEPGMIYLQTRGQLLAIKTAVDGAMENLDSYLEFLILTEVVDDDDLTTDEEGWELDTTPKKNKSINGKKQIYS